jgi:hypothetical protein
VLMVAAQSRTRARRARCGHSTVWCTDCFSRHSCGPPPCSPQCTPILLRRRPFVSFGVVPSPRCYASCCRYTFAPARWLCYVSIVWSIGTLPVGVYIYRFPLRGWRKEPLLLIVSACFVLGAHCVQYLDHFLSLQHRSRLSQALLALALYFHTFGIAFLLSIRLPLFNQYVMLLRLWPKAAVVAGMVITTSVCFTVASHEAEGEDLPQALSELVFLGLGVTGDGLGPSFWRRADGSGWLQTLGILHAFATFWMLSSLMVALVLQAWNVSHGAQQARSASVRNAIEFAALFDSLHPIPPPVACWDLAFLTRPAYRASLVFEPLHLRTCTHTKLSEQ